MDALKAYAMMKGIFQGRAASGPQTEVRTIQTEAFRATAMPVNDESVT